ncbi:hypothetical protein ACIBEA_39310 [Streptomyces sp. NPDC051555]|uniref:hypothetical protein n=1 Tax=Streptomyces sp. NPDC051555 TaxID=3365657 RepID=UPI0037A6CFB3
MSNQWAHVTNEAELLYPGVDIEGALKVGAIAVAIWNGGGNGIVIYGPKDELRDRLLQLAAAVDNASPAPSADACISVLTDPRRWKPGPLPHTLAPLGPAPARCDGLPRAVAADPRLATCPDCVETWNNDLPHTRLSLSHPIPALP